MGDFSLPYYENINLNMLKKSCRFVNKTIKDGYVNYKKEWFF